MESMRTSIFYNISKFLKLKYDYELNLSDTENYVKSKIAEHESIKDKNAQKHLRFILLPAASIYEYLIEKGLSEDTILHYIEEYVMHYYQRQAKLYRLFGKLPFFYGIFRHAFPLAMKAYPTPFWSIKWLRNDKQEITFDITDCLYYRTFQKYKCEKLTSIFCRVDHLCYDDMSKKVRFIRTNTLGNGNDLCNFRFVRVK